MENIHDPLLVHEPSSEAAEKSTRRDPSTGVVADVANTECLL